MDAAPLDLEENNTIQNIYESRPIDNIEEITTNDNIITRFYSKEDASQKCSSSTSAISLFGSDTLVGEKNNS